MQENIHIPENVHTPFLMDSHWKFLVDVGGLRGRNFQGVEEDAHVNNFPRL